MDGREARGNEERERIEKGSRERIEKRERDKKKNFFYFEIRPSDAAIVS